MQHSDRITNDVIGRSLVEASYGAAIADILLGAATRLSAFVGPRIAHVRRAPRATRN